jgi:putative ABC transport system substrate-binding protein
MRYSTIGLIGLLTLTILVAPRTAAAQPPAKVVRLGYLSLQGEGPSPDTTALLQGLRDLGYVDGHNLVMESRFAAGKSERLPDLAAALLRLKVDVLVTFGCTATRTAANATTTTPIVIAGGCDPVRTGLIASLAQPGGNITGSSSLATELSGKRLEILKEGLPTISRVAVLWNTADRGMTLQYTQMQAATEALGVTLHPQGVRDANDIDGALAAMTQQRPDALYIITDVLIEAHMKRIVDFAANNQIPTMFAFRGPVAAGGLMAYGVSTTDQHQRAAYYVDRILKGAKPADLPVEQPMRFALIINLKTAKALGITIPPTLLFQADEVIK